MPLAPVSILGGLPVIAEVRFGHYSGTAYSPAEDWSEVDGIYWMKRDGSAGKPIPDSVWERAEKSDPYFAHLIEQVMDYLIDCADEAADHRRRIRLEDRENV